MSELSDLKARLLEEITVAAETAAATPLERFVAEALTSDDAKAKGLVDRVWVVSLPDARKAIAAIDAYRRAERPPAPMGEEVERLVKEARQYLAHAGLAWTEQNHSLIQRLSDRLEALSPAQPGWRPDREENCHADRDGDCSAANCPQLRDGEPRATGRHCPLDRQEGGEG